MLRSAVIWLVALCLFVEPGAGRAQSGNLLLDLPYLAQTDPQAALARIEEELAALEASGAPDARLAFDLYRMAADLLVQTGRQADAADTLMALGQFAQAQRALLQADPAEHFAAAADLYRALGDWPAARAALEARLAEDRDGARPAEVIADDLRQLSDVAQQMADPAAADSYRAAAAAALAPVDSATRGTADGYRAVDVYYGTDRARSGRSGPDGFYGAGRGTLELGIATVTIPDVHVPGLVEKPSIWRLEFRADPARHVVLQSVTPLEADAFYTHLHGAVEQSQRKEAFVFIHGYNVSFDKAARRAAQIAYDMSFAGVPILYSWPSADSTVGYMADAAVVQLSARRLSRFLDDLRARSGAETIHIVAHSMGNRALTEALELLALRNGVHEGDAPVFGQVLFAAPDVDAGLFREMLPTIRPLAERLTLYASDQDWALVASRKLHGNMPRAGIGGQDTLADPNIDSIDMSELGEDMLMHSYFADDSSAMADMMTLFGFNVAPQRRCGLIEEDRQGQAVPVWDYRRGVCADRSLIGVLAGMQREGIQSPEEAHQIVRSMVIDPAIAARLLPVVDRIVSN